MQRARKQLELGLRWLTCGRRLFARNPWLLGGMGLTWALAMSVLAVIPVLGGLLIAFLAPLALASAYLAIDNVSRQKAPIPAPLRMAAFKQSPQGLVTVFSNEEGTVSAVVAGVYSLTVVLVVNVASQLVAGGVWVSEWASLDPATLGTIAATGLGMAVVYGLVAASLIFALPLTLLQDEPLFPAIARSLRASARYGLGLVVIAAVTLLPFVAAAGVVFAPPWTTYLVWIGLGTLTFPLAATSAYCSYRTLFPVEGAGRRQ